MRSLMRLCILQIVCVCAFSRAEDPEILHGRIQALIEERNRLDSSIAAQRALQKDLRTQKEGVRRASENSLQQQQTKVREASQRIVEISRKIDNQRNKNRVLASRDEQITTDSLAAAAHASRIADSIGLAIRTIIQRKETEIASLSELIAEKNDAEAAVAARETEQRSAARQSHEAITRFDVPIAAQKIKLQQTQNILVQSRNDSSGLHARLVRESERRKAEIEAADKQSRLLLRQADSLAAFQRTLQKDSATARGANDDSVRAANLRLLDLQRLIAEKDTTFQALIASLNRLRKDSLETVSALIKERREREENVRYLDSLIPALQNGRSTLQLVAEKLQLDSMIEALTPQGGARLSDSEAQKLDGCKGKSEILLRNSAVAAMLAEWDNPQWRKDLARIVDAVGSMKIRLDSASAAREQTVNRGVFAQTEQQSKIADLTAQLAKLSSLSAAASRELVNARARLGKITMDSAAAVKRRDDNDADFRAKIEAAAKTIVEKNSEAQAASGRLDELRNVHATREAEAKASLDSAHAATLEAAKEMQRERTALDSIIALQNAARADSIAVDKEKLLAAAQARQELQLKREAVEKRNSYITALDAQVAKARSDSISAMNVAAGQIQILSQSRRELQRLLSEGQLAIEKFERELSVARQDSSAAMEQQSRLAEEMAQQVATIDQQIAAANDAITLLSTQRAEIESNRVAVELELQRLPSTPPPSSLSSHKKQEPAKELPQPAPTAQQDSLPGPSRKQTQAQDQLVIIYQLIGQDKIKEAKKSFLSNRNFLKNNLDPEAYAAISATIDALVETVEEAPAFSLPAKETPEPKKEKPAKEKKPAREKQSSSPAPPQAAPLAPLSTPSSAPMATPQPEVEAGKPATIFISTIPPGSEVYVDGQFIGKSNVGFLNVTSGRHTVQFIKGEISCTREMVFVEGKNPTAIVRLPCD